MHLFGGTSYAELLQVLRTSLREGALNGREVKPQTATSSRHRGPPPRSEVPGLSLDGAKRRSPASCIHAKHIPRLPFVAVFTAMILGRRGIGICVRAQCKSGQGVFLDLYTQLRVSIL